MTTFTEQEKNLAKELKTRGLKWHPQEGDWFWATEDYSHQFYLGENLPSSYSFQKDHAYCFDSSMTWHIEQGGLNLDKFVWLPTWEQCRSILKGKKFSIHLDEKNGNISIETQKETVTHHADGKTEREAIYSILLKAL